MTIVYIASPIDQLGANPDLERRRTSVKKSLIAGGAAVYDPSAAWQVDSLTHVYNSGVDFSDDQSVYSVNQIRAKEHARDRYEDTCIRLQESNLDIVRRSDLVVALSPPGVPSIGTPIDAYVALTHTSHARVALWAGSVPWGVVWTWMFSLYPDRVMGLCDTEDSTIRAALDWAREARDV